MSMEEGDRLIDTHEAARLMGLEYNTVVKARSYGGAGACPWIRLGRSVRYRLSDIHRHIAANVHTNTARY